MNNVPVLRAMARNYVGGHQWDQQDGEAVAQAADHIEQLEAELDRLRNTDHSKFIADLAAQRLIDSGAENFVGEVFTIEAENSEAKFEIVVTTQKVGAKTPGDVCNELRAEVERLTLELNISEREKSKFIEANETLGNVVFENMTLKARTAEIKALLRESSLYLQAITKKLNGFHDDNPGKWCGYLDDALGAAVWQQEKIDATLNKTEEPK